MPAHERERGGVTGVHFGDDLADRRAMDKWRATVPRCKSRYWDRSRQRK